MLNIEESRVLNKISIDRESVPPSSNTNASVDEEQNAVEGKEETVDNEHKASEDEVGKREWCNTDDGCTHPLLASNKKI